MLLRFLTDNDEAKYSFVVLEVTLEFAGKLGSCFEVDENIITVCLIVDGICEMLQTPFFDAFDNATVSCDDAGEFIDASLYDFTLEFRCDDIQSFVLVHAFSPPYGLMAAIKCGKKYVSDPL